MVYNNGVIGENEKRSKLAYPEKKKFYSYF